MDKRLLLYLIPCFIVFTIIGTLSHEGGHYFAAKYFGYNAHIRYAFTHWEDKDTSKNSFMTSTYLNYETEINAKKDFPGKERFLKISKERYKAGFWMIVWGPLQTMLTGTLGFILILFFGKSFRSANRLRFWQWLLVFSSLFWLRQIFNMVTWIGNYLIKGEFRESMDEIHIANHFHLPIGTIIGATAIVSIIIASIVIFKFIPKVQRKTFIVAGLVGGVAGYVIWLVLLGPVVMP